MIQLAYTSLASQSMGSGDVFKIIEKSARNNSVAGLTGFLIYNEGRFFQVIEGPTSSVEALIERLKGDPRHHSITVVHHCAIASRSFPQWRMKRVTVPGEGARLETLVPELADAPEQVKRVADRFLGLAIA